MVIDNASELISDSSMNAISAAIPGRFSVAKYRAQMAPNIRCCSAKTNNAPAWTIGILEDIETIIITRPDMIHECNGSPR